VGACLLLLTTHVPAIAQVAPAPQSANKLSAFIGEWTLKDDQFQQVWGGKTVETLKIPNHFTKCDPINTEGSVLCVVSAGDLKGHILWVMGANQQVHHLSHFGTERTGVGGGALDDRSDLTLKISFRDEPEGTYRQYEYSWVSADEYTMVSRQYDKDGRATGNWYGGTFVRLPPANQAVQSDTQKVNAILKKIDADVTDMSIYSDDVVHMAGQSRNHEQGRTAEIACRRSLIRPLGNDPRDCNASLLS
jgi:hypothetical protein